MPRARTDYRVPYSWIASALRSGVSPSRALETFREAGFHVTTQTWFKLAGAARRAEALAGPIREAPLGRRPRAEERLDARGGQRRKYLFGVELFVVDRITGEDATFLRTVGTDRLLTYGAAIDAATAAQEGGDYIENQQWAITGAEVFEVWG